jgi:hypothetical protein
MFVACEFVPIVVMLDYSYMQIIGFERDETEAGVGGGGLQSQIYSLIEQDFSGGDGNGYVNGHGRGDDQGDWLGGFDLNDSFDFMARNVNAAVSNNEPATLMIRFSGLSSIRISNVYINSNTARA